MLLFHCIISLLQGDYNWGLGQTTIALLSLITDEDIDLLKDTPTKEATLKALQRCWYLLTVVGETREKRL